MYWDVVAIRPLDSRRFAVRFEDGLEGVVAIAKSFCEGVFTPLRDDMALAGVQLEHGVMTWPEYGLDLAPDTMYTRIRQDPCRYYELHGNGPC